MEGLGATLVAISLMLDPQYIASQKEPASASAATAKADRHAWLTGHPTIVRMHQLENAERARYGLGPFVMDPELCVLAQQHANWMLNTGYYTHSNYGIPEIIHHGPQSPEGAVTGWIYSPAHHAIMLSGSRAGFGYAQRNGYTYWVTLVR